MVENVCAQESHSAITRLIVNNQNWPNFTGNQMFCCTPRQAVRRTLSCCEGRAKTLAFCSRANFPGK